MVTRLSCDSTHCLSVIKASPLSTVPCHHFSKLPKTGIWTFPTASRPEPESPWLFLRVNTLLGNKGSHSDMDIVLKVSLLKEPAKSQAWSTRMEDNDGVSLVSTILSMLLGSLGWLTSFRDACPAWLLLGLSK